MNRSYLIFRHEFLHTVRRTGYLILTLAFPVLALLGIGIFRLASGDSRPHREVTRVGYVDESGRFGRFTTEGSFRFVPFANRRAATRALVGKQVEQYFVIPGDFMSTGRLTLYATERRLAPPDSLSAAIKRFVTGNLLAGRLPSQTIDRVQTAPEIRTTTLTPEGDVAREQGGYGNFIVPALFSLLLALSLAFSSGYMLQALSEEKENRLMEILLSSVSTRQLLAGKVLGFGSAGLLQVAVWAVSIPLLLDLAASSIGGFAGTIRLPAGFWLLGVGYFVLGYSLFAVLSACVAAVTRTLREAQGIVPLFTLFSVAPFWFLSLLMLFPGSAVWVVFSIFPPSAPVLVLLRMGITGVPRWQLATSIGVLITCIACGLLVAAKLLRVYLLMYGKRPTLGEIVRVLRRR